MLLAIQTKSVQTTAVTLSYILMIVSLFFASAPSASLSTLTSEASSNSAASIVWFHSPALLSIGMIIFCLVPFAFNTPKQLAAGFLEKKEHIYLTLVFLYLLIGFFYSGDKTYLLERLQIKLPFLLLPFAASSSRLTINSLCSILFTFICCCTVVAVYVTLYYAIHFDEINTAYLNAKVMPTPMNHVRFSILASLATYCCYYLIKNKAFTSRLMRQLTILGGSFLFIFVHIYSVRSGLLALYGILATEMVILIVKGKLAVKQVALAALALCCVFAAMLFSPTFRNKIANTRNDLAIYRNNGYANYNSLTTRFISYEIAMEIYRSNKLLGCGVENLDSLNKALFRQRHPEIDSPIIPHNQFLYYLAGTGLVGTAIFIVCFFFPLFYHGNYKNELLLMTYVMLTLSFLTEPMIETQLGVACTLIFILLGLNAGNPIISAEAGEASDT